MVGSGPLSSCAAVTHCNRWRRVTMIRASVRTMASPMVQPCSARKATSRSHRARAIFKSAPRARSRLFSVVPGSRRSKPSKKGIRAGAASATTRKLDQISATSQLSAQPAAKPSTQDGAVRLRRRLSIILTRPTIGSDFPLPPIANTQGRSCQSPRAQRWFRRTETS